MGRKAIRARKKALDKLLEKGVSALALGIGLLVVPRLLHDPALGAAFASGTRTIAWLVIAAGVALIALHFFVRRLSPADAPSKQEPQWTSVPRPDLLRHEQSNFGLTETPPITRSMPDTPLRRASQGGRHTEWGTKVFDAIEWRRFEAVCERLFAQGGFETRAQSHGPDGGVDIWLHSRNADGPAAIVQCKHWTRAVGVKEIREFFGVMASHQLKRGTFATTSTFTPDAMRFAKENGINAMGPERLLALIASRTPQQQIELLDVAYEGEYWKPTCASCGIKMVEREAKKTAVPFWGCARYPTCKSTLPMRAAVA